MLAKSKITCVFLNINDRGYSDGWSVGCELWKNDSLYFIFSLYLPKSEFKNKTKALRHLFSLVFKEIDENEKLILFYSPMKHFYQVMRLHAMTEEFKNGRKVCFFKVKKARDTVEELELDASIRKESVRERL